MRSSAADDSEQSTVRCRELILENAEVPQELGYGGLESCSVFAGRVCWFLAGRVGILKQRVKAMEKRSTGGICGNAVLLAWTSFRLFSERSSCP